jgi:hypothetical protein
MDERAIPGWVTGPDCSENAQQRKDVEWQRQIDADDTIDAYALGNLHTLANSIEEFQAHHRLLFRVELADLHDRLVRIISLLDEHAYSKTFPVERKPTRYGHSS